MKKSPAVAATLLALLAACTGDRTADLEHQLDHVEAKVMEHERLIAECMAGKGWEYIPHLSSGTILEREVVLAEAEGREFDPDSVDLPEDPNDQLVARLSDAEREARADAYWGDIEKGGIDPGCYHSTYTQAWGEYPASEDDSAVKEVDAAVAADERVIAAFAEYIDCMAQGGYQVSGLYDIHREYDLRKESLAETLREQGVEPDEAPEMQALRTEEQAALQHQSACADVYYRVEDTVRNEKWREHG